MIDMRIQFLRGKNDVEIFRIRGKDADQPLGLFDAGGQQRLVFRGIPLIVDKPLVLDPLIDLGILVYHDKIDLFRRQLPGISGSRSCRSRR